jgi:mono/diheme cytochrome c family protein
MATMASSQKQIRILGVAALLVIVLGTTAFLLLDVTAEANPSWIESRIASSALHLKLRLRRPTKTPPITTTEADLERASDLYIKQCAFCHGTTRGHKAPYAESFSPRPPQFVIQPSQGPTWSDMEVIRHGVRWTAMPAFPWLAEEDAWGVAMYVEGRTQPKD